MENIVKSAAFMDLYYQQYPEIPELSPVVSEVTQSVVTSHAPTSPTGESNGKLGKTILITGLIVLAIYGGYRWYIYNQAKKIK